MHMRTGRGLDKAVEMIKTLQLQAVQIFTDNPSAWRSAPVDPKATAAFKAALEEMGVRPAMSHAMYLINLASPNPNFQKKSREALKAELERAEAYGLQYVVTHVGSHMGEGAQAGIDRVVAQLDQVLSTAGGSASCLLETSAGGGAYVGAKFDDLAQILSRLPQHGERLGVCFDTAHAYASGYDVAGAAGLTKTLEQRSEERRVGKEWRSRGAADQLKKKKRKELGNVSGLSVVEPSVPPPTIHQPVKSERHPVDLTSVISQLWPQHVASEQF